MESKWTKRTTGFSWGGRRYEWRYGSKSEKRGVEGERGEGCHCLILLERVEGEGKGEVRTLVARFVRGEETRTPGTKKSHAGNGGRLEMALERGGVDLFAGGVGEEVVVATVLVMLKKEVDRLRGGQIAVIGVCLNLPFAMLRLLTWKTGGPLPCQVLAFMWER